MKTCYFCYFDEISIKWKLYIPCIDSVIVLGYCLNCNAQLVDRL